jgi:hypothetical protein
MKPIKQHLVSTLLLSVLMTTAFTGRSAAQEPEPFIESPNAAGAVTIDVAAYANLCGEWTYRTTEDGVTETWTHRVLGTAKRYGKPVYIRQTYSSGGYPNDQGFFAADLSKGLYEVGGLNDFGKPTEDTFQWTPAFPHLMKTFIPGKEYVAEYRHSFFPGRVFKGKFKTEKDAVTVPYGKFDCYKVTLTASDYIRTKWYAKHIGVVRQENGGEVEKLASYDPAPWLVVEQPAKSALFDGVSKKSFGTQTVGKPGLEKTFTVLNLGTKDLTGLAISKNGAHAVDFSLLPPQTTALPPGKATTFKVTFTPTATGTRNAAIHIKSNDADENVFDIKLSGQGAK